LAPAAGGAGGSSPPGPAERLIKLLAGQDWRVGCPFCAQPLVRTDRRWGTRLIHPGPKPIEIAAGECVEVAAPVLRRPRLRFGAVASRLIRDFADLDAVRDSSKNHLASGENRATLRASDGSVCREPALQITEALDRRPSRALLHLQADALWPAIGVPPHDSRVAVRDRHLEQFDTWRAPLIVHGSPRRGNGSCRRACLLPHQANSPGVTVSDTTAAAVAKSGVHGGAVVSTTSTSRGCSLPAPASERITRAGPVALPGDPQLPPITAWSSRICGAAPKNLNGAC